MSTDNALKRWKEEGAWIRDGDFVTFPAAFVDDAYQWMRSAEESSEYTYPNTFRELLEALPPLTNPGISFRLFLLPHWPLSQALHAFSLVFSN